VEFHPRHGRWITILRKAGDLACIQAAADEQAIIVA
jgi:hypothetical protein